jgi:hypothetical protein
MLQAEVDVCTKIYAVRCKILNMIFWGWRKYRLDDEFNNLIISMSHCDDGFSF